VPKWLKFLLQFFAIGLVFAAPLIHIFVNYGMSNTEMREVRVGGLNIFWLTIVFVIGGGLALYLIIGVFAKWLEKIKKEPFGAVSIAVVGGLLILFFLGGVIGLRQAIYVVENYTQELLTILKTYKVDMQYLLGYSIGGQALNVIVILFK